MIVILCVYAISLRDIVISDVAGWGGYEVEKINYVFIL